MYRFLLGEIVTLFNLLMELPLRTLSCFKLNICEASEIDGVVADAIQASAGLDSNGAASSTGGERTMVMSSPVPAVSRPSRPGRGRARLTKRS